MKIKIRIFLITAVFVIFFAGVLYSYILLNSQNQKKTLSDKVITLALRQGVYSDVIKKQIPDFEKQYNISCIVKEFSESGLRNEILTDYESNKGEYDFCMVDGSWMAEYTENNVLASLSDLDYELDDDIIPATKSICYYNNELYLAPFYGNVTVLLYNKLLVKEAGYSVKEINSLEDILKICRITRKNHNYGFMYRGDTYNNIVVDFLPILLSYGGWVVDGYNNPTVNTNEFRLAMNMYLKLIETGRAAEKDDLITAVANCSAAMAIGWPGWYTPTRNSAMDYLALTGKAEKGGKSYNANIYGIWTVGIPSNSRNKEEALTFLEYIMNRSVQKASVEFGGVPCRYSSLKDREILKKFPQYEVVCQALEGGVYRPVMKKWPEFYTILGEEMQMIIRGEKDILTGLSNAQIRLQNMMNF
ncbi:extracellular solute-binding protein [Treponema sp.]|uniref:extracellular solute-binding protein n=1 Tax=Treponema sp. TaxID=166 RepID=UPI00388DEC57